MINLQQQLHEFMGVLIRKEQQKMRKVLFYRMFHEILVKYSKIEGEKLSFLDAPDQLVGSGLRIVKSSKKEDTDSAQIEHASQNKWMN